jgi:heptosyltransferase-1
MSRYDAVLDFQGNTKSGFITFLSKSALKMGFGVKTVSEKPNLLFTHIKIDPPSGQNIRLDYMALAEAWVGAKHASLQTTFLRLRPDEQEALSKFTPSKDKKNVMVCPGSKWPNKALSQGALQDFLLQMETAFVCKFWLVYGTAAEKQVCESLKLGDCEICKPMSLPLLQHWMRQMDQVIAMDSLPLHLAAEAGTPTFSVFGASSAKKYQPLGAHHKSFQGSCPYGKTFDKRCAILRTCTTGACIHSLTAQVLTDRSGRGTSFSNFR